MHTITAYYAPIEQYTFDQLYYYSPARVYTPEEQAIRDANKAAIAAREVARAEWQAARDEALAEWNALVEIAQAKKDAADAAAAYAKKNAESLAAAIADLDKPLA